MRCFFPARLWLAKTSTVILTFQKSFAKFEIWGNEEVPKNSNSGRRPGKGFIGIRHGDRRPYRPEEIELAQALAHQACGRFSSMSLPSAVGRQPF